MDDVLQGGDPGAEAGLDASGTSPQGQAPEGGTQQQAPEPTIADVLKQVQGLSAHVGRISSLQSKVDTFPKTIEELISKKLAESNKQQMLNQLPPDQRAQYEQQEQQRADEMQALERLIKDKVRDYLPKELGDTAEIVQELKTSREAKGFFNALGEALGPEDMAKVMPFIGEILEKNQRDIRSDDPAVYKPAIEWIERAMKNPESVGLAALRMAQARVQTNAGSVVQQREAKGRALSTAPRTGAPPTAPRDIRGMSQSQLDQLAAGMSTADFEKLVNASKR